MKRSTRSSLFPDVNVWVALTHDGHQHHTIALNWFVNLDDDARLFFCRITQLGLLRLLSQAAVMGTDEVMSQAEAWDAYDALCTDSRVAFLPETAGVETEFRRITMLKSSIGPKNWADSYLTAFAEVSGLTLVTFDRAFARRGIQAQILRSQVT